MSLQEETANEATEPTTSVTGGNAPENTSNEGNKTVLEGGTPAEPAAESAQDWRAMLAGEDAESLKALRRFDTPDKFVKAYTSLRQELSTRPKEVKLPDSPTEEQRAEWLKSRGAPEKADGYLEGFQAPDWFQAEKDQPVLDSFAKVAHERGMPAEDAAALRDWYFDTVAAQQQQLEQAAAERNRLSMEELAKDLGGLDKLNAFSEASMRYGHEALGAERYDALMSAQMADGTRLGDNPEFARLVHSVVTDAFGEDLTAVAGDGATTLTDVTAQVKELHARKSAHRRGDRSVTWTDADEERFSSLAKREAALRRRSAA